VRPEEQEGEPVREILRDYWDADAATYDRSPEHEQITPLQRAVWSAILSRLLPPPPATVLDVGAGTGFLSIPLARLGYAVTALDISRGMLTRLQEKVAAEGLAVAVVEQPAEEPPAGPFDVVVERLVLWTLLDPGLALERWRAAAPAGRLVSFGATWVGPSRIESVRTRGRFYARRLLRETPQHHGPYPAAFTRLVDEPRAAPEWVLGAIEDAGWVRPRLERLRDAEWAHLRAEHGLVRLFGAVSEYAVRADAA
jgi:SAM-dependent methyltransferase